MILEPTGYSKRVKFPRLFEFVRYFCLVLELDCAFIIYLNFAFSLFSSCFPQYMFI